MTHSTVIAFCFCGAQSLLVGDISFVWWVQVCRNDACHQRSLLYFSLIHIYYRIFFLVIPILSRRTRYSWSYGHLIFFIRGYGGPKVCDAESLFSLLFLVYFSLIHFLHSIHSLILPLLCRGSMYSLSYGYLNFFQWRSVTQKGMWPRIITVATFPPVFFINSFLVLNYLSNVTFSVLWEYVLFELWLFEFFWWRYVMRKGMWPRIITFTTFPPVFFIISSFTPYLLSNDTFIVLWEYVLFELQLFENFLWRDVTQKVNNAESLLSLLLLLYICINSSFASYLLSNDTFIVTCEQILLELRLFERILNWTWLWSSADVYLFLFMI
jgi:hypothetical protein